MHSLNVAHRAHAWCFAVIAVFVASAPAGASPRWAVGDESAAGTVPSSSAQDRESTAEPTLEEDDAAPSPDAADAAAPSLQEAPTGDVEGDDMSSEDATAEDDAWGFSAKSVGIGAGAGAGLGAAIGILASPLLVVYGLDFLSMGLSAGQVSIESQGVGTALYIGTFVAAALTGLAIVSGAGAALAWLSGNLETALWAAVGGPLGLLAGMVVAALVGAVVTGALALALLPFARLPPGSAATDIYTPSQVALMGGLAVTAVILVPVGGIAGASLGAGYAAAWRRDQAGPPVDDVEGSE